MAKEGGIHVAYQPLSGLISRLTTRLGRVKQVIMSYGSHVLRSMLAVSN